MNRFEPSTFQPGAMTKVCILFNWQLQIFLFQKLVNSVLNPNNIKCVVYIQSLVTEWFTYQRYVMKTLASKVEEIVENGEIPEEDVHLPGVYVKGVLKGSQYQKRIEVSQLAWVRQGEIQHIALSVVF